MTMQITIPKGFFPPPGVPFETKAQRDAAIALSVSGIVKVQWKHPHKGWEDIYNDDNSDDPDQYRLSPPTPRKVGPFESEHNDGVGKNCSYFAAHQAAVESGFKNFRIRLTATAEEIL
jgi:hypothetical protein